MKSFKLLFVVFAAITLVFSSCSIEKRVHRPGYSVKLNKFNKGKDENLAEKSQANKESEKEAIAELSASEQRVESQVPTNLAASSKKSEETVKSDAKNKPAVAKNVKAKTFVKSIFTKENNVRKVESENLAKTESFSATKDVNKAKSSKKSSQPSKGLLIVLCFFIPWLAVGLATDWDVMPIIYNILWTLLCGIPGIIHGIIVVNREM